MQILEQESEKSGSESDENDDAAAFAISANRPAKKKDDIGSQRGHNKGTENTPISRAVKRKVHQLTEGILNANTGLDLELNTLGSYSANGSMNVGVENEALYSNPSRITFCYATNSLMSVISVTSLTYAIKELSGQVEQCVKSVSQLVQIQKTIQENVTPIVIDAYPRICMLMKNKTEPRLGSGYLPNRFSEIKHTRRAHAASASTYIIAHPKLLN